MNLAASQIAAGVHDVVIGGGVEHMGKLPFAATMKVQQEFGFAFTPELMARLQRSSARASARGR